MKADLEKKINYYILLGPAFIIYSSVIIFPIVFSFGLSMTGWKNYQFVEFVWFHNFIKLLQDVKFYKALWNNILIMLTSIFGQIPLGIIIAYILFRGLVKGKSFFEAMIFLPITISSVVIALLWNRIFSPIGIYTSLIRNITHNPDYVVSIFENEKFAMIPILFVLVWVHTSLYMVMFLANMQRIPTSILEAARIDGASEFLTLRKIILPALTNVVFTSVIFAISGSFKSFDLLYAMTGGGPVDYTSVLSIYLYKHTFTYSNYGFGSAISLTMVMISVGFILIVQGFYKRSSFQKVLT